MEWLVGGAEIIGGAASTAGGVLLTWVYRGGPPDLKHIVIVPIAALLLLVIGLSVLVRGMGLW